MSATTASVESAPIWFVSSARIAFVPKAAKSPG
jgi:hypothetical protein